MSKKIILGAIIILSVVLLVALIGSKNGSGGMAGTYVNQRNENDIMKLYGNGKFDNIENGLKISGKYGVQQGFNDEGVGEVVVLRDIPLLDAIICPKIENGFECPGGLFGKDVYIKK